MKIYTMTLNPAFDVHAEIERLLPFHENFANVLSRDAGGKGVNISRALANASISNTAVVVLGKENGAEFRKALSGLDCLFFERDGCIRENLTLHASDGKETRISFSGFSVSEKLLSEIQAAINIDPDTVITFTGSVPNGLDTNSVLQFLLHCKKQGAKIVLDSRSFSLQHIYALKPWLIKPNQQEISAYFGEPIETMAQAAEKAREIAANGVENVMISLGESGALLLCENEFFVATPPKINAISTIGAGDSTIAGFISAADHLPKMRLKTAVAFGTAACLTAGSLPPKKEDISRILPQIKITKDGV